MPELPGTSRKQPVATIVFWTVSNSYSRVGPVAFRVPDLCEPLLSGSNSKRTLSQRLSQGTKLARRQELPADAFWSSEDATSAVQAGRSELGPPDLARVGRE